MVTPQWLRDICLVPNLWVSWPLWNESGATATEIVSHVFLLVEGTIDTSHCSALDLDKELEIAL